MASQPTNPPNDDDDDRIIDAPPDPQVQQIADISGRSTNDASFAQQEANFSRLEHDYSDQLATEGRNEEANRYSQDASAHMTDAERVMMQAKEEERKAERLRQQQRGFLSQSLQALPNQQLVTLRDAVKAVRLSVEDLTPRDLQLMQRIAAVNEPGFDEALIEEWRETVINTAITIEVTLGSSEGVHHNAAQLVRDLSVWIAAALELAKLAQPLKNLIEQYGHLLLQFHF